MQKLSLRDRIKEARVSASDSFRGGKLMSSIFRPGSIEQGGGPKNENPKVETGKKLPVARRRIAGTQDRTRTKPVSTVEQAFVH